ncbi:hypothetical protein [Nitrospira sp. Ecomares 2.1]
MPGRVALLDATVGGELSLTESPAGCPTGSSPSRGGQALPALRLSVGRTLSPGAWVTCPLEADSPCVATTRLEAADTKASQKDRDGNDLTAHRQDQN